MHRIVETQRKRVQHCFFQRNHGSGHQQLLQRRVMQFSIEHSQHFIFGNGNVFDRASIVEQTVIRTICRIEIHFHRHHKIHRGDQNRQECKHGGHIVIWRTVKQTLHFDAKRPTPSDHQMGEQADSGEQSGQRQRQKLIDPLQKQPRMLTTLRKIPMQQEYIPYQHHTIAKHHRKQQRLHRRACQRKQHA